MKTKKTPKGATTMKMKLGLLSSAALAATAWLGIGSSAQAEFNVQCPGEVNELGEVLDGNGDVVRMNPADPNSPAETLCFHVAGSDGFIRMADGTPLYSFGFSSIDQTTSDGDPIDNPAVRAMKSNLPAPLIRVVEGQKVYLTMSNVPFVIRPDLFDPHSVHWHGFPNASAIFDGVPDNSVSNNPLSSMTYFYNVVRPGTYMWHCHVEAAEHMQMGMLGNLYVEPAQNYLPGGTALGAQVHQVGDKYAYNDGDGSTAYDLEMPLQIHSFDPTFHNASHDVQPLPFADMEDRYPMFNGRGYPDTVRTDLFLNGNPDFPGTVDGGLETAAQPESSLISAAPGEKVLVRISSLSTTDYYTIVSPDLPMQVVGQGGEHRTGPQSLGSAQAYYDSHQVTLGGGQAYDVLVDIPANAAGETFFIYSSNLNQLSNDHQDYGGMMTEIRVSG